MTATGHAIIGVVIASKIANPYIAIPLAIASHLAADAFPHWDTATNKAKKSRARVFSDSIIDVTISLTLPLLLAPFLNPSTNLTYVYIIVFFAQFWDWATAPYFFLKMHFPPFTWPYRLQKIFDNPLDKPWGIIGQVGVLLVLIIYAKLI